MSKDIEVKSLLKQLPLMAQRLKSYAVVSFIIFIAGIYGFVGLQITSQQTVEPTSDQVAEQVEAINPPHIDEEIVKQLEALQDTSISVKALFDEARQNPFVE